MCTLTWSMSLRRSKLSFNWLYWNANESESQAGKSRRASVLSTRGARQVYKQFLDEAVYLYNCASMRLKRAFQISTYSRVSNYGGTTSNGVRREHAWLWNQVHGWPHRQVTWPLHCLCAEDGPRGGAHVFRNQRLLYMNWTGSHVAIEVMMIAKNHEIWYIVFTYLTCLATSQCVLFQEFHNGIPSTSQILDIDT